MDIMIDFNDKSERERTHELLKQAIKEAGEQIKVECPTGTLKALEKLIETQEKIIEEQKERIAIMTEHGLWIPVEERLPDNYEKVLIYDKKWGVLPGWHSKNYWNTSEVKHVTEITHWMPNPTPPKAGEQNERT